MRFRSAASSAPTATVQTARASVPTAISIPPTPPSVPTRGSPSSRWPSTASRIPHGRSRANAFAVKLPVSGACPAGTPIPVPHLQQRRARRSQPPLFDAAGRLAGDGGLGVRGPRHVRAAGADADRHRCAHRGAGHRDHRRWRRSPHLTRRQVDDHRSARRPRVRPRRSASSRIPIPPTAASAMPIG